MTEKRVMPAPSFRLRLHQAVATLACVIVVAVSFSFFSAREVDRAALRSQFAHETLAAHITLSSDALRLFKVMSDAALLQTTADRAEEDRLARALREDFKIARKLILDEAANFGRHEDESQELDRLSALELEFEAVFSGYRAARIKEADAQARKESYQLLAERIERRFNALVAQAIAEERREVKISNTRLRSASQVIRTVAIGIAFCCAVLVLLVLRYVSGALLGSLRALGAGAEAYARGDFEHRIPKLKANEFEAIRQRFTQMADEVAANREAMRTSNARLEQEVSQRTAALAEANARLEASDEARRGFFADVSHELRTPLTVIRGEAEIALRGADRTPKDYRESLARIVQYVGDTTRLVDDLLFIARADAGEPRLELQSVALGGLVAETVRSFEPVAAARGVSISSDVEGGAVVVRGDRGRLRQVVGVVLDNAIRYSRQGGEVRVTLLESGGAAEIIVEDDGIGIPDNDRDRVFDRFFRAENARAHAGGSGLGLPVAKSIVEAHKGHILIAPSATGGVAAKIWLPSEVKLRAIS